MKKTFLLLLGFSILIISVAFTTFDPPGYKNLKVLPKDISEKALDSIMHFYSVSLGSQCDFCHVHNQLRDTWDMASDAKPEKLIARKMMLMTDGINKKYFPPEQGHTDPQIIQAITCYTCHRGEPMPSDLQVIKRDSINSK